MLLDENVYIFVIIETLNLSRTKTFVQFGLFFDTIGQIFSFSLVNELIEVWIIEPVQSF